MGVFTLTLTLSLKGEGIAELRKSYPDSDNYFEKNLIERCQKLTK